MTEPAWTVEQSLEVFTSQGAPVDEWRLRKIIQAVSLQPAGRAPSGELGGIGKAMYPVGALQEFHGLITRYISGDT